MSSRTEAFKELVQRDKDVCNNCFRRTHDTIERNYAKRAFKNSDGEPDVWWEEVDLPSMRFVRSTRVEHMYPDSDDGATIQSCKCGQRGIPLRPVELEVAMTYAKRVATRLDEKNIDFDRDTLLDRVRMDMQRPENQSRLDSVLGHAVQGAIKVWTLRNTETSTSSR